MLFLLGDWSIKDNREWFLNFPWHFVAWYYFFSWVERGLLGAKCWTSSGARFSIESSPHRFPPSLPFPPLLLHTLTSCDFGEKWRGRGGGFIFITRKDGYRLIKRFFLEKKENADDSERKLSWDYSIPRKFTHRQRVKTDKFFNVQPNYFETSLTFLFQDFPLVSDSVQFFCSLPSILYCFTTRFSVISINLVTQSSKFPISFICYFLRFL